MGKKIPMKKIAKFIQFLEIYKEYVGLTDWSIYVAAKTSDMGTFLAEVEPEASNKLLKISLSEKFLKKPIKEQSNILFHELLHGRISIFNGDVEAFKDIEEETLVNDIIRGFERIFKGNPLPYSKKILK